MKKVNLKNKLALNKESIAKLNNNQMGNVMGGEPDTVTICGGCETGSKWKCCNIKTKTCGASTMC